MKFSKVADPFSPPYPKLYKASHINDCCDFEKQMRRKCILPFGMLKL